MSEMVVELARLKLALWLADLLNAMALVGALVVLVLCWALCDAAYRWIKGF